ncbi:transglycosylase family protein [Actinomadura alba]|uniref:Transglycosylase family protein n=2 Tax=Actinomadura alba TaxID=406431 RepID=A0ABR7LY91_9ACTN|nr:transglycosylase family protein [Actinomadura alba]
MIIVVVGIVAALVATTSAFMVLKDEDPATAPVADSARQARTPIRVVVHADRRRKEAMTTAGTVREVLGELGIQVGTYDIVRPPLDQPPAAEIKVYRLLSKPVTRTLAIPPPVIKKKNKTMFVWDEKVLRKGRPGIRVVRVAYVPRKGKKVKAIIAQRIKRKPVAQIVAVGTKGAPTGGAAARLNWKGLADCESNGNPKAINAAGYYGLYQFSLTSWASVGGTGRPSDASPAEQTYRAQQLYNRVQGRWQGQWPHCGKYLFS